MNEVTLDRRQLGLLLGSGVALTLAGCGAPVVGLGSSAASSAVNVFGRALGLAIVGNELTKVVDFIFEKTVEHFRSMGESPPSQIQAASPVYYSDTVSQVGNVYVSAIAFKLSGQSGYSEPEPVMFAANGRFVNLVPRAVLSIAECKPRLTELGVAPSAVAELTLPLDGKLVGTKYDVSYSTARGRLGIFFDGRTNTETVTITGVPGRQLVSWSFPVDSLTA